MSMLLDDRTKGSVERARVGAGVDRTTRSKAAQRALDRRSRRQTTVGPAAPLRSRRIGGIPLVYPVLLLIVGALGLTLYLTTKSAQDSYALDAMREQNQTLQDKRDNLQRQYDQGNSAAEIADKAGKLDMVPAGSAVQIVVGPDGKARRVGAATPADGKTLPALNPAPDPLTEIAPDEVDDSEGLDGSESTSRPTAPNSPSTTAPATTAPTTTGPTTATPPTSTPSSGPAPNVRPSGDPRRQVSAPRANVTPSAAATPTPNTRPTR